MLDKKKFNRFGTRRLLTEDEKIKIKKDLKHKNYFTLNDLTVKHNVSLTTIKKIKRGINE